jgi:ComF family protein
VVNILNNILSIFFPKLCFACTQKMSGNEQIICTHCRHNLPLTNFHLIEDNPVKRIFLGRINIENATSFLLFQKKGKVQQLIHHLKYKGHEEIGSFFGSWMGQELALSEKYNSIDTVIPVPLHKRRQRKRGYNQVHKFAEQLALNLKCELSTKQLSRKVSTKRLVFKKRGERWDSLQNAFWVSNQEQFVNKHLLLVDDVVTTGATLEACANVLLKIPGTTISIATLAFTE